VSAVVLKVFYCHSRAHAELVSSKREKLFIQPRCIISPFVLGKILEMNCHFE